MLPGARSFLTEFWQKKPLFAHGALPQFAHGLDRAQMLRLACRDDVESRLVIGARQCVARRARAVPPARLHAAAAARLDAARERARSGRARRARAAAGIRFHSVLAARRRNGELCDARRQRWAAFRQLRRMSGAGNGQPALEDQRPAQSGTRGRRTAQDSPPLPRAARLDSAGRGCAVPAAALRPPRRRRR